MNWKAILALGSVLSVLAALPAQAKVRVVVRDGKKLIYNDGVGEPGAAGRTDGWIVARMARPSEYDDLIRNASARHDVDPRLVKSVMLVESNFNPRAISKKGARGLMQLMPGTARSYGVQDPHDPTEAVEGGTAYLSYLIGFFDGDLVKSLAAYNAGENAVLRYEGVPPYDETRHYVRKTLTAYYGRDTLTGGFGLPGLSKPSAAPAAQGPAGRRVRLRRDANNRIVLTTGSSGR